MEDRGKRRRKLFHRIEPIGPFGLIGLILLAILPLLLFILVSTQKSTRIHEPDSDFRAMLAIAKDSSLTTGTKFARLKQFIDRGMSIEAALNTMELIDARRAIATALELFHNSDALVWQRLTIGRWLMWTGYRKHTPPTPHFEQEYAAWLAREVIKDNGNSFMAVSDGRSKTAVGQFAWWAAGFGGFSEKSFPETADCRVIPVLIRCLDAPDDVWPKEQGDYIRGKPGTSTGRNLQRQFIPIALVRLKAIESIPDLERVLRGKRDIYLRMNAAFALGALADKTRRTELERELVESAERSWFMKFFQDEIPDAHSLMFDFGRGLIRQGDAAGIPYLGMKWYAEEIGSTTEGQLAHWAYWVHTRIEAIGDFRDVHLINFYRTVLKHPTLASLWRHAQSEKWREERLVEDFRRLLGQVQANNFVELAPEIKAISEKTTIPAIATAARDALSNWPR